MYLQKNDQPNPKDKKSVIIHFSCMNVILIILILNRTGSD